MTLQSLLRCSDDASANVKIAAVAGLAALIFATEAVPAFAASSSATGQGALLDQLLAEQQAGKVKAVTIKSKSAPEPAVAAVKKQAQPAPKAKAPASKPASKKATESPKPVAAAKTTFKLAGEKPTQGSQGAAPAGLELPTPKGAIVAAKKAVASKPVAAKKVAAPKPSAAKRVEAPKPVVEAKKAAVSAATAVTAVASEAKQVSKPAPKPAPTPTPSAPMSAPSLDDSALQAGAVLAAELVGVAIASSIVGGLTSPRASKA